MAKYRLSGQRWLKCYTAAHATPVYAASVDAQTVVDRFCEVPWKRSGVVDATFTSHSDVVPEGAERSGLDQNVLDRESFDAALFCAGHVGGKHRVYANAACYRFTLPDEAVGHTLDSISAGVSSDPYNSAGVRLHVFTNSTGEIPASCNEVRGVGAAEGTVAEGAVPRTEVDVNGIVTWYAATQHVTLSPAGGLVLQKYLFLYVGLESYSTVRGNWCEGSSFIRNLVEIDLPVPVAGWQDGGAIDLSGGGDESLYPLNAEGVLPEVSGEAPSSVEVVRQATGDALPSLFSTADGILFPESAQAWKTNVAPSVAVAGLRMAYASLYKGEAQAVSRDEFAARPGARFLAEFRRRTVAAGTPGETLSVPLWTISASLFAVPFAAPKDFAATKIRLEWSAPASAPVGDLRWRVWIKRGSASLAVPDAADARFYLPRHDTVDGFVFVGEFPASAQAGNCEFAIDPLSDDIATVVVTGFASMDAAYTAQYIQLVQAALAAQESADAAADAAALHEANVAMAQSVATAALEAAENDETDETYQSAQSLYESLLEESSQYSNAAETAAAAAAAARHAACIGSLDEFKPSISLKG